MKILSIDVGILHLGMVGTEIEDFERSSVIKEEEIYFCDLINITSLINNCKNDCELYHDKTICDYMMHFFKKYRKEFDKVDKILVERQPLTGLISVQDLILREYREKTILISPNSMLKYFDILKYEYEHRKTLTEKIASSYLIKFKSFCFNTRKHDMADAFCILYYFLTLERKKIENKKEKEICIKNFGNFIFELQKYKYKPFDKNEQCNKE